MPSPSALGFDLGHDFGRGKKKSASSRYSKLVIPEAMKRLSGSIAPLAYAARWIPIPAEPVIGPRVRADPLARPG